MLTGRDYPTLAFIAEVCHTVFTFAKLERNRSGSQKGWRFFCLRFCGVKPNLFAVPPRLSL